MPLTEEELQEEKSIFLARPLSACALSDSYNSSVRTRNPQFPVFCGNRRGEFQNYARHQLCEISDRYLNMPGQNRDNWHINNIEELRNVLQEEFAGILHEGHMRFGVAQKMLNLYLKHLWARDRIETPPHCPFDRVIIDGLPNLNEENFTSWTEMDDINEYMQWVDAAGQVAEDAGHASISEWELVTFNEYQAQ